MTVICMKQARPDEDEIKQLWKLYHAADAIDTRYHGSRLREVYEELKQTDLSKADRLFILRAWNICIESGTFSRLLGAYDTWVYNVQDPALDYCEYKPELQEQIEAGGLATVYEEAYKEARDEFNATQGLDKELLDVIRRYGWNVDAKNAGMVLNVIMHRLEAFNKVGQLCARYMLDPEALELDNATVDALQRINGGNDDS